VSGARLSAINHRTGDPDRCMRPECCGHPVDAWNEAVRLLEANEPAPLESGRHVAAGAAVYVYEDEAQAALAEALSSWIEAMPARLLDHLVTGDGSGRWVSLKNRGVI